MHSANHRKPHIRTFHQHSVPALQAILFAVLSAVLQCALALVKPGSLGFGDVTATLLMGLAVGMFGLFAVVFWWLAIGVVGLLWLVLWTRFDPQKHTAYAGKRRSPQRLWQLGR